MQNHLCKTLAHFVIFIGTKVGISIPVTSEQNLLDLAHNQWQKEKKFLWTPTWNHPYQKRDFDHVAYHASREKSGYIWNMRTSPRSHTMETSGIEMDSMQGLTHTHSHLIFLL
jgi:hypothetical protein